LFLLVFSASVNYLGLSSPGGSPAQPMSSKLMALNSIIAGSHADFLTSNHLFL
jgi:hypothetical protein